MNKIAFIFALFIGQKAFSQNLQLMGRITYPGHVLANIGGYVDTAGHEYALVGTDYGLDIVDVTNPSNPVSRFTIHGAQSDWREVKTYRKYAYVTTEGGGGLTIVDLSHLPDTVYYHDYTGDGVIAGQLSTIHALHCDTAKGFLYLYGSNLNQGSTMFFDLSNPLNPVYSGGYLFNGDPYVHDGFVMNDTMYEGHIYGGFFDIVDVRNKSVPVLLGTQSTPTAFTHNTWLSDDHHTIFTTDENSNSYLTAYNITDPANIQELSRFQTAPGSGAIVHNTHILNNYAITSWYREGVIITDVTYPDNPIEMGHYDTDTLLSGNGFDGCWGVYPFLPSGTIVASDINNGLFVLTPTYIRGCYLNGIVSDSISGLLINGASVQILTTTTVRTTNALGEYHTGTANAGTYDVLITKPGYNNRTIIGVQLSNGNLTSLNVLLVPLQSVSYSGNVSDSSNGLPLNHADVIIEGNNLTYTATSNGTGLFSFPAVVVGTYTMTIGKWGYRTQCSTVIIGPGTPVNAILSQGYYDDFSFDNGWTVSGTSLNAWELGEPTGTYDNNNNEINPELDVSSDCGGNCFVTDNGGAPYNNHDVDNGNTILTSPPFDLTIYTNPVLSYFRRFLDINGLGQPNDSFVVSITNGIDTVLVEQVGPNGAGNGTWISNTLPLTGLINFNQNMQLIVRTFDDTPGNIVEGAFDQFEILGDINTSAGIRYSEKNVWKAYPNPFNGEFTLDYDLGSINTKSKLIIKDITGKTIEEIVLSSSKGKLSIGKDLNAGIYVIILQNSLKTSVLKIVKE